jgi:hypothetical protein
MTSGVSTMSVLTSLRLPNSLNLPVCFKVIRSTLTGNLRVQVSILFDDKLTHPPAISP